ncbi:MAG: ARMT1-like domain-containing protein [Pyrodictiaceae archaeon]
MLELGEGLDMRGMTVLKANPLCTACLLTRRAYEVEEFSDDPSARIALFKSILETANLYLGPDIEAALLASMTYRRLRNMLGSKDLYEDKKRKAYEVAKEKAKKLKDIIYSKKDAAEKLSLAIRASTVASVVQSVKYNLLKNELSSIPTLSDITAITLHRNDVNDFSNILRAKSSPTVVFMTGTVAELPYDYILMDVLRDSYSAYVLAMVRSEPYEAMVFKGDLEYAELEDHVDEIVEFGSDTPTLIPGESSSKALARLEEADVVIAKGCLQTLTLRNIGIAKPVLALLYIECSVAARILGVREDTYNAILL